MVLFTVPGWLADSFRQETEEPPAPQPQPVKEFDPSRRSFLIGAGAVVAAPIIEQATHLAALTGDLYAEEAPATLSFRALQQDAFFSRQYTVTKDTYTVEVEGQAYTAHRVERTDFELPREPTVTDIYRRSNFIITDGDQVVTDNLISSKAAYAANYSYAIQKTQLIENTKTIAEENRTTLTNTHFGVSISKYTTPLTKALSGALVKNPASLRAAAVDMLNAVSKNAVKEMVRYLERQADGELSLEELKKQISSGDLFVEAMLGVAEQGVQELEEVPRVLAARRGEPLSFEQARAAGVLSERGYTHTMAAFTGLYAFHKEPKNFIAEHILKPVIEGLAGTKEVKPGVLVELVIEKAMETYKVPLEKFFRELARQQLLQEELYGFEAFRKARGELEFDLDGLRLSAMLGADSVSFGQLREAVYQFPGNTSQQARYFDLLSSLWKRNREAEADNDATENMAAYFAGVKNYQQIIQYAEELLLNGQTPEAAALFGLHEKAQQESMERVRQRVRAGSGASYRTLSLIDHLRRERYRLDWNRFDQAMDIIRHQIHTLEHSQRGWREEQLYRDWRAKEQWLQQHGSSIRGRGYATPEEMEYMNSVLRGRR